jgi:hypothetical protein
LHDVVVQELFERCDKSLWLLPMWKMAATCETREHCAIEERRRVDGIRDRNHPIAFPPKESHGRKHTHLVCPVEKSTTLPTPIDDVADTAGESARAAGSRMRTRAGANGTLRTLHAHQVDIVVLRTFAIRVRDCAGAQRVRRQRDERLPNRSA